MARGRRAQIWRYAPQYRRPRHFHSEPELNLITAGTGSFGTGDTVLHVKARDLLCWPPGCDHELIEASVNFDLYVFALKPELSERVLGHASARIVAGAARIELPPETFERLLAACLAPITELEASVVERHVAELWQSAHASRSMVHGGSPLGRRALASLLEQPQLSREVRARTVRAFPTELSRHFHRDTGLTLSEYRTRLRLLQLIERVDAGSSTLLAAALEAGFGSYSQCHRAFTQVLGCGPRQFFGGSLRRAMDEAFAPRIQR